MSISCSKRYCNFFNCIPIVGHLGKIQFLSIIYRTEEHSFLKSPLIFFCQINSLEVLGRKLNISGRRGCGTIGFSTSKKPFVRGSKTTGDNPQFRA